MQNGMWQIFLFGMHWRHGKEMYYDELSAGPRVRWKFARRENSARAIAGGTNDVPRPIQVLPSRRSARRWFSRRENRHHSSQAKRGMNPS
jgi:hypothetical protein